MYKYYFNDKEVTNYSEPKGMHGFRDGKYWVKIFQDINIFTHELDIIKSLTNCSGVVEVVDTGKVKIEFDDGSTACFPAIKELYVGEKNICQYCTNHYEEHRIIKLFLQLAHILFELEKCGIIHNDLKRENILIAEDETPILIDFNISKNEEEPLMPIHTNVSGELLAFTAPEKKGDGVVSLETDIYSFGCVLKACMAQCPSEYHKYYSRGLVTIMRKCMKSNPDERFHSFKDIANMLEKLVNRRTETDPAFQYTNFKEFVIKNISAMTALFYACGVIVMLVALFLIFKGPERESVNPKADIEAVFNEFRKLNN